MQPNNQQGLYQPGQGQPVQSGMAPPPGPVNPTGVPNPAASQPLAQPAPAAPQPGSRVIQPLSDPTTVVPQPLPQQPAASPALPQQPVEAPQMPTETEMINEEYVDEQGEYDEYEYDGEPVTWSANEYIHREKGAIWYFFFIVVIVGMIAVSVLTQAWTFTALSVVIALVVIVYTRRPPRELTYSLTDEGLTIDGKLHAFSGFKSFGIIRDGGEYSVMLIPTQRFQPGVSVYFPEEAGEDIVDMLGARLPMKDLKLDAVDRIVRLIRL